MAVVIDDVIGRRVEHREKDKISPVRNFVIGRNGTSTRKRVWLPDTGGERINYAHHLFDAFWSLPTASSTTTSKNLTS